MTKIRRTVWVVRHGNRADFIDKSWRDTAERPHDPPLSPDGVRQAQQAGAALARQARVDHIFCSPFLRTVQTAQQMAAALNQPVKIEHGFCEMLYERWFPQEPDYLPLGELVRTYGRVDAEYQPLVKPDWPETEEQVVPRVQTTLEKVMQRYEGDLLIVGHGGVVQCLSIALLGDREALQPALCCLVKLNQLETGAWYAECDGADTSHLDDEQGEIRLH